MSLSGVLLSEMSWDLIFMLIALGAVVAVVGDQIGMRFGKKRISLFGLRPRYTSRVTTIVTGMLITLATLAVLGSTSETVRAALFGMKYLQGQVTDLTKQLQTSRQNLELMELSLFTNQQDLEKKQQELEDKQQEVASVEELLAREADHLARTQARLVETGERTQQLEKRRIELEDQLNSLRKEYTSLQQSVGALRAESKRLKEGLQQMREGHILAFSGELLAQTSLSGKVTPDQVDSALQRIRQLAEVLLQQRKKTPDPDVKVVVGEENLNSVRSRLNALSGRVVLRLTALANAVSGEPVACEIKIFPSKQLFQKGELLTRGIAPANLKEEDASDVLYGILKEINQKAIAKGVLPDPLLGTVGNLSTIDFYEAVDKIANKPQRLEVSVYAAEDVYSEGPVRVYVKIQGKNGK